LSAEAYGMRAVFGPGTLDSLDRKILEIICAHGREGQSFNKLVAEVKPFASRSTFALRAKRLVKLNYAERFPDGKNELMVRIRGSPMMLLLTRITSAMRSQCAELELAIRERGESVKAEKTLDEGEVTKQVEFINQSNEKIKGIFSLIGVYAVNLGETAAGDIILPMVVGDFRRLNSALTSLIVSNPKLMHTMADKKLAGVPLDQLSIDFRYAFGADMAKVLPNFSKHLKKPTRP
jgi:DNA-binding Lrp family transcriptional regulator